MGSSDGHQREETLAAYGQNSMALDTVRSLSKITSARLRVLLVLVALVPVAGSVVAVLLYAMFRFRELGHPESTQQGGG